MSAFGGRADIKALPQRSDDCHFCPRCGFASSRGPLTAIGQLPTSQSGSSGKGGIMKKQFVLVGSAVLPLIATPILTASIADARTKDKPNMEFCKSGAKVGNIK